MTDSKEIATTKTEVKQEIKMIFDEINWLCNMYDKLGFAEATGNKYIRDGEMNWDRPLLNKKRQEILNDSKTVLEGNYMKALQFNLKQKRKRNPDAKHKDNLGMPILISETMVKFFNAVDLGTTTLNGKKVKVQKTVQALNAKERIISPHAVSVLFKLWIQNGVIKHEGKVVQKGLVDPTQKSKVVADETFMKFFGEDIKKIIEDKTVKRLPILNDTVVIEDIAVQVPCTVVYPTFFMSLLGHHRTNLEDKEKKEKMYEFMKEEHHRLKALTQDAE